MVKIQRGDVVFCDLNPVIGSEQSGIRPAVVVQINRANLKSPHTIVAPCTTKIRKPVLKSHYLALRGHGGLTKNSVILCEQIRTIDKRRIIRVMGTLSKADMEGVDTALKAILNL